MPVTHNQERQSADLGSGGGWDGGAERRQLTVLFCDLVGSTALSSTMDPEDLHDLMLAYQRYCTGCIEAAGGYVAHYAGDGVVAFFGYPVALEDAPQRAIHAAMRLRVAGEHLPRPDDQPLAVRTGVATGLVVVGNLIGEGAAQERAVAGETPNLAARLQASASPNAVVVSDTTKRLAEGVFEFKGLGMLQHKGLPSALPAWEVVGQSPTVNRFEGRRGAGIGPLVSRDAELHEILRGWLETRDGRRRVVGIVGDPGLGKSRLLEEVRRRIRQDASVIWHEGGGVRFHEHTPFHVVAQFAPGLAAASIGAGGAGPSGSQSADAKSEPRGAMGLIASVLGGVESSSDDGSREDTVPARENLMRLLRRRLWAGVERGPTVLVIEDLHWVDPSTLELLDLVVRGSEERPLLVIYTSRTDFTERWPVGERHRVIALKTLDDTASATLARSAAENRLSLAQIDAVVAQAAGVPLYIEELARLVARQQDGDSKRGIPSTLADLLAVRLAELGQAKRHAQVAAVLGHEFPAALFGAMIEPEGVDPEVALAELQASAIIVPREEADGAYAFRHALIATAAYEALLKRQRRDLHARAAKIITERYPTLAEAQPQVLARHWAQAGDAAKAVAAWEKAGDSAKHRRAFREAEHAYREALSALDGAAASANRDRLELRIRAAFNRVLQLTQGYSAFEAARSSQRVSELAAKVGSVEALSREESAKWRSVFTAGDYAQAETVVARIMSLTEAQGNALWRKTFFLRAGIQHGFYTGNLARGERDFLDWSAVQDGSHRGSGDDVLSMGVGGLIAQMTGRQAIAEQRMEAAFAIARRRDNPYDLAMALHNQACLEHFSRDVAGQARSAARLADVAGDSGFEYASHLATGWLAIANTNAGHVSKALDQAQEVIAGFKRLGARVSVVFWLSALARAHHLNGDHGLALGAYAEAIAFNRQERAFRVEAFLGRARLLIDLGRTTEAERDLRCGIRLAAAMGAIGFQLRSLVELARLHVITGDRDKRRLTLGLIQGLAFSDPCAADRADIAAAARETAPDLHGPRSTWPMP